MPAAKYTVKALKRFRYSFPIEEGKDRVVIKMSRGDTAEFSKTVAAMLQTNGFVQIEAV